jgi:capsule polysaccharide export protein KpsE/RkpR
MSINRISNRSQRKRLRHAERNLLQAQKRLVQAQRSVASWTQELADPVRGIARSPEAALA